ncbi:site-specific integrase (plasmid) [Polymorphobacter megasporae]|nr:site-specific integrase [Polymorphobacter megasporae]
MACPPPDEARAGYLVPVATKDASHVHLTGTVARRRYRSASGDRVLWDDELVGFGLRLRKQSGVGGNWIVKFRSRGEARRVTLGKTENLEAPEARAQAKQLLAKAALDGLPMRAKVPKVPTFEAFVAEFWRDYHRHWKPSTQKTSAGAIHRELVPFFGAMNLAEIAKSDIVRWRDCFAESRSGVFNRAVPVLSVMFKYAELLGYRPKGSNPCRGIARYKRELPERFLSPIEYFRLARVLEADESDHLLDVAIVRLLIFTGARSGEIEALKWRMVQPSRLMLDDSKTGAKIVYLNEQAEAVLAALRPAISRDLGALIFPMKTRRKPRNVERYWAAARRRAALPDVRLHDLRHSFASAAITRARVPFASLGKLLAHALPETTARYAHLADEAIAEAAERVCGGLAKHLGLRP